LKGKLIILLYAALSETNVEQAVATTGITGVDSAGLSDIVKVYYGGEEGGLRYASRFALL
jgi:hypothetical protein